MSFLTKELSGKITEERTREEVYMEFKEALFNNESVYRNCLIKISDEEIIIREITLEDVLMALKNDLVVDEYGHFWKFIEGGNPDYKIVHLGFIWTLGLPASQQSNETLMELTKLLTDK